MYVACRSGRISDAAGVLLDLNAPRNWKAAAGAVSQISQLPRLYLSVTPVFSHDDDATPRHSPHKAIELIATSCCCKDRAGSAFLLSSFSGKDCRANASARYLYVSKVLLCRVPGHIHAHITGISLDRAQSSYEYKLYPRRRRKRACYIRERCMVVCASAGHNCHGSGSFSRCLLVMRKTRARTV
ncbi:hypothetical protein CCMA1212_005050 [Trichoderma ghanense]|uniref:Uncharacterized protein n=1 Tax=Trichoderma ghanense TaxID=65468 RepID=A0ABY2H3K6_9HYPO